MLPPVAAYSPAGLSLFSDDATLCPVSATQLWCSSAECAHLVKHVRGGGHHAAAKGTKAAAHGAHTVSHLLAAGLQLRHSCLGLHPETCSFMKGRYAASCPLQYQLLATSTLRQEALSTADDSPPAAVRPGTAGRKGDGGLFSLPACTCSAGCSRSASSLPADETGATNFRTSRCMRGISKRLKP